MKTSHHEEVPTLLLLLPLAPVAARLLWERIRKHPAPKGGKP